MTDNRRPPWSPDATAAATLAGAKGKAQSTSADTADATQSGSRYSIIGLKKHIVLPEIQTAWRNLPFFSERPSGGFGDTELARRPRDTSDGRIADMENQGVDMQVLSSMTPGVVGLAPAVAISAARDFNDALHAVVQANPDRFQAFATLATQVHEAAAEELERCVMQLGFCGAMIYARAGDRRLDDPAFDVLYATAVRLGFPLNLQPISFRNANACRYVSPSLGDPSRAGQGPVAFSTEANRSR